MTADERDAALRTLAGAFSQTASGQPLSISVGAAALFVASQCDAAGNPDFDKYVASKLRAVADIVDPPTS